MENERHDDKVIAQLGRKERGHFKLVKTRQILLLMRIFHLQVIVSSVLGELIKWEFWEDRAIKRKVEIIFFFSCLELLDLMHTTIIYTLTVLPWVKGLGDEGNRLQSFDIPLVCVLNSSRKGVLHASSRCLWMPLLNSSSRLKTLILLCQKRSRFVLRCGIQLPLQRHRDNEHVLQVSVRP